MDIDAFINDAVKAHNRSNPAIIIWTSCIAGRSWYFLYARDSNIWSMEEVFLYKFLYERLSQERIYPSLQLRVIFGKPKIGIAFEVKS